MKQYNEYKKSGIDWLGKIPASWQVAKLKYNAEIAFSSVDRHEFEEGKKVSICHYPNAYKNEFIDFSTELSHGTCSDLEFEKFQLKKGQVIITKDSESADDIGVPTFVSETFQDGVCGYHLAIITPNMNKLNGKYLFRYIQSQIVRSFFETKANGVTRFGLGKPTIENLIIPSPSLKEQTQITKYLDYQTGLIDAIIEKKELLIEKLKAQRQAIINEAVTKGLNPNAPMKDSGIEWLGEIPEHWEVVKLKYNVNKIGSGVTPRGGSEVYTDEGVMFLRSQNIYSDGIRLDNIVRISEEIDDAMKSSRVEYGDVLLNITGASIGRSYYWDKKDIRANVNQHVCIIRPNEKITTKYLQLLIVSEQGQSQIFSGQVGTSREGLNFEELKNFKFAIPPLEEMEVISSLLDAKQNIISNLIVKFENQLKKLKTYRQSIISEAVTGNVDVRDWQEPVNFKA